MRPQGPFTSPPAPAVPPEVLARSRGSAQGRTTPQTVPEAAAPPGGERGEHREGGAGSSSPQAKGRQAMGLRCLGPAGRGGRGAGMGALTDGKAKATLELALAVVEEGAHGQR